jgi:hypothetical protein
MGEAAVIEVRSGRGDPKSIALTPGSPLDPTSVGRAGMWRVEGAGVLDVHCYFYFDGRSLYVQSADDQQPVLVNKHQVACAWTEVRMPSTIELGGTQLVYRIDVSLYDDGDATVARAIDDEDDPQSRTAERPAPRNPFAPDSRPPPHSDPPRGKVPPSFPPPQAKTQAVRRAPPSGPQLPPMGSLGTAPSPISSPALTSRTVPLPAAGGGPPRPYGEPGFDESTRLHPLENLLPQGVPLPPAPGGRAGALQIPAARPAAGTPLDGLQPSDFGGMPGMQGMPGMPGVHDATTQLPHGNPHTPMMMMQGGPGMMPVGGPGAPPMMGYGQPWNPSPQSMQVTSPGVAGAGGEAGGLEKLKRDFEALPPIKRVLLVMSPFVLVAAGLLLFGDDAPPPQAHAPKPKQAPSATASVASAMPSTPSGPETMAPIAPGSSAQASGSAPTSAGSAPAGSAPKEAAGEAASAAKEGTPKESAPKEGASGGGGTTPADLPYSATSIPMPSQKTLERQAADAWAGGSFELAAKLYDQLAATNPGNPAFAQAARVLRERLDGGTR